MRASRILLALPAMSLVACGPRFDVPAAILAPDQPMVSQASTLAPATAPPTDLAIPAAGVLTELIELGLQPDRSVEVPDAPDVAGWYVGSPKPGEVGPAALIGHIDSHSGPGVFYRLAELRRGHPVYVRRADGSVVTFLVERVERYPKDAFPTERVYGNTDRPELRLITCGGEFDRSRRSYRDNIVVFAVAAS